MKKHPYLPIVLASVLLPQLARSQPFDISTFDVTSKGPWSEIGKTTLMVPKVPNGSIKSDGSVTDAEYGGFTGVTVTPGVNAWILDFPADRFWDGAEDSSFTFWLAHDDDYFYVAVDAKDDIVNSDDLNAAFWKDDAIEIVVDALNNRTTDNTDASKDAFGGHSYFNFEGRFSMWDDAANAQGGQVWASGVPWIYGATNDVFGFGKKATGGWKMEGRFKKNMFEDPVAGNKLRNGYVMGFNICMDDDDKTGPGLNGDQTTSQDLQIQYIWANRPYYKDYNAAYLAGLTEEDKAAQVWRADTENHPLTQDGAGRNSHAVTGEIIFGYDQNLKSSGKILFLCVNAVSPVNADAALIALLQAKGYTVTPLAVAQGSPLPDALRAAAVGQDLVFISETPSSLGCMEPIGDPVVQKFILRDTDIPVVSFEAYMWDNAEWTAHPADFSNEFSFFGNTGRTDDTQPEALKAAVDSLYIRNAAHPIAKGITQGVKGIAKVFKTPYSLNYGKPSADADVIASVLADGTYPTLFVYEKGDKLVDGSVVPNKRIGLFLGQAASLTANWTPELGFLTEDGKTLLLNTVDYAIGKTAVVPPTISIGKSGANVVITYAGGTLQSSATMNGVFATEVGASPLTIVSPTANKFYRVKAN